MCRWKSPRTEAPRFGTAPLLRHARSARVRRAVGHAFVGALTSVLASAHAAVTPLDAARPDATPLRTFPTVEPMLLGVLLNGVEHDDVVTVLVGPDGPALPAEAWEQLHLRAPRTGGLPFEGRRFHLLGQLAVLNWRIDESRQVLVIQAPSTAFAGSRVALETEAHAVAPAALGGFANYDLQWQRSSTAGPMGRDWTQGLLEFGGFHDGGTARLTGLVRTGALGAHRVRLDTTWTHDVPSRLASLRLGDSIGRAGAWGRAVRFGGVQWSTDFSMQPGFLSFPLPTLRGEAALPSTVDVYVNNSHRLQSRVPAGPFDLSDVPLVTGEGQIRMVVRDLLGREQVITRPYYVSPSLLRPGLRAFSYELGALREDYGVASSRYGRTMATVTEKRGISAGFTRELRAEAVGRQVAVGATGIWLLPGQGTANASVATSHAPGAQGSLLSAGADYQSGRWSGSMQGRYTQRGFRQLGQSAEQSPRSQFGMALGTVTAGIALSANWLEQRSWTGQRDRIASFNAARTLGGWGTLGLFVLRDVGQGSTTLSIGFSTVLDGRTSANTTASRQRPGASPDTSLQVQRAVPEGDGFGFLVGMDRGEHRRRSTAQAMWQSEHVALSGGMARTGTQEDWRLGASGGLAVVGDSVFASRRIDGSFAVVDVGGYPDVQVLHDHRPVARTDARGRALVSGLRAYEPNRIGVNPSDLPLDAEVERLDMLLVPPARSGTHLRIPVTRTRSASFRLVTGNGSPVPPGSMVRIAGQARSFPVGLEGRTFVTGLAARSELQANWHGHGCTATVPLDDNTDEVPDLGTVLCR
jgi:outer membrane usher protein